MQMANSTAVKNKNVKSRTISEDQLALFANEQDDVQPLHLDWVPIVSISGLRKNSDRLESVQNDYNGRW
jgi:hypothetical protein